MKSYTTLRNLYGTLTQDDSSTNLTLGDELINDTQKIIISSYNWDFDEESATISTVASQQAYNFRYDFRKLINVTLTIGTTVYPIAECPNRQMWDRLNQTSFSATIPTYFFIYKGQLLLYPTPSASSNTITVYFKKKIKDLSAADYTTGNITTLAASGTAVTGSGTSWTSAMIGRYFKVNSDGYWYKITAVASTTSLTIERAYGGTAISAGSEAYTIGEMPLIAEEFQQMLPYKAASIYYATKDEKRVQLFSGLYNELYNLMKIQHGNKTTSPVAQGREVSMPNPNNFITY